MPHKMTQWIEMLPVQKTAETYKVRHQQKKLYLGNLYTKRDWGYAGEYVEAMWKILQLKKPDDFIIATGKQYSIKIFINKVCKKLGLNIYWKGKGLKEVAVLKSSKKNIIQIDKKYFRPSEVDSLKGDMSKARKILKWQPKINIDQLISLMIEHELKEMHK